MQVRLVAWPALLLHWQRGGRSAIEIVTVVTRFFLTTISHSTVS